MLDRGSCTLSLKYRKNFPERFANPINKRVHSTSLFRIFASLEGNISCILNSVCINLYITYHRNDLFFFSFFFLSQTLFYAFSIDVNKFSDVTSSTLIKRRDSVLKEMFPPGNYKLYFPQKLAKLLQICNTLNYYMIYK